MSFEYDGRQISAAGLESIQFSSVIGVSFGNLVELLSFELWLMLALLFVDSGRHLSKGRRVDEALWPRHLRKSVAVMRLMELCTVVSLSVLLILSCNCFGEH